MRNIVAAWVAAIFAALVATSAAAQSAFPTRTVKFIVPFPGGGINDAEAQRWGEVIKKNNIVVD
jgi:tripartite-type tricarboxylate transporter receptor subunit TctC